MELPSLVVLIFSIKGEMYMVLYSSSTCPKCKVLKMKLEKAGIKYTADEDIEAMQLLGIKSLPYLQLDNGTLLDFGDAVRYLKEKEGKVT